MRHLGQHASVNRLVTCAWLNICFLLLSDENSNSEQVLLSALLVVLQVQFSDVLVSKFTFKVVQLFSNNRVWHQVKLLA